MVNRSQDIHQSRKAEQIEIVIDVEKVVKRIDYENKAGLCKALPGLHTFTGCDTTNMFYGRGEVKARRAVLKHDSLVTFRLRGKEWEVSQKLLIP